MKHRDAADSKRYRMLAAKFIDKYGIDITYPQRVVYIQNVDNSTGEIKGTKKKATGTNVAIEDTPES